MKNSCKVMKKIHFLDSLVNSFNDVNELNIHTACLLPFPHIKYFIIFISKIICEPEIHLKTDGICSQSQ